MQKDQKAVQIWLFVGVVMVFMQIVLGGITRLTGSGLSITHWDVVTGVLPPWNEAQWNRSFDLYKGTPQYQKINQGISLSDFKFIFFWEYFHRLWARSMGLIFLFPFLFFLWRRSLSAKTIKHLSIVIGFAMLAAIFGWIMVASGLIERPWVNAYKLTVHLSLGICLFISMFYTWLYTWNRDTLEVSPVMRKLIVSIFFLSIGQVLLGGMVSGMKSSLMYPTWPGMHGSWMPDLLLDSSRWNLDNVLLYDQSGFMPTLVQFLHRNTAYLITGLILVFIFQWFRKSPKNSFWIAYLLLGIIVVQVIMGILTLRGSIGSIPVFYGAAHQGGGILLLTFLYFLKNRTRRVNI